MKIKLVIDDVVEFEKEIVVSPPIPPEPPTPPPLPIPEPVPPNAIPFLWDTRIQSGLGAGAEAVYAADVGEKMTSLSIDLTGMTNETDCEFSWTFPDGTSFSGTAMNTSNGGAKRFRSRASNNYPNIDYDYIPFGIHLLRIKAIHGSSLVIRGTVW